MFPSSVKILPPPSLPAIRKQAIQNAVSESRYPHIYMPLFLFIKREENDFASIIAAHT